MLAHPRARYSLLGAGQLAPLFERSSMDCIKGRVGYQRNEYTGNIPYYFIFTKDKRFNKEYGNKIPLDVILSKHNDEQVIMVFEDNMRMFPDEDSKDNVA